MAVNPLLLTFLVCPLCKSPLTLVNGDQGLKCTECHRVYPIRDDIPVMIISEATIEN
jgi:LSD1 subclass zinc finger protein